MINKENMPLFVLVVSLLFWGVVYYVYFWQ